MTLNLKFHPNDFKSLRDFENAVQRQVGKCSYVSAKAVCLYFPFPKDLADALSPMVTKNLPDQLEFTLDSETPLSQIKY